ncbi:MAG: hypothetical protein LUF89_02090 [Ruminococcus sp.]|nr:hypothetical protein [Ruminococcus sp.]
MESKGKNAIYSENLFTVTPCDDSVHPKNDNRFVKLEQTEEQDICMSGLASQLPTLCVANAMSSAASTMSGITPNMYIMHFPKGVSRTPLQLRDNRGITTTLTGKDGKFVDTAWLTKADT